MLKINTNMKKVYAALVLFQIIIFSKSSFAQIPPTTRTLQWNLAGARNWPTVAVGNTWDNKANWINTATGLAPATNVTNGDKLIIPAAGNITVNASMTITFTNFIIEIQGNGRITIGRGFDLNLSATNNTAINLVSVAVGRGLILQRKAAGVGGANTTITMNGRIKALNTSTATNLTFTIITSAHALATDASTAVVTGFGGFIAGTLPVVLTSFNANLTTGKKVAISWTTQQEVNADFFDVEKSADGLNWKSIGTVKAAGYSSSPRSYSYIDNNPFKGSNFYRVRINDLDGKFGFTPVKNVRLDEAGRISLYPNPSTDVLNISLGELPLSDWSISLFNSQGQILIQKKFSKNTTIVSLPVNSYATGNYILKIADGNSIQSNKIIINHH
jgi:Secretion system C-terminal sorting domain